uniref:Uncharacterized protein n=1 Tax=Caenorhabditis japonica TaxID=281687 RepID=A0A8R1ILK9_CAEJA
MTQKNRFLAGTKKQDSHGQLNAARIGAAAKSRKTSCALRSSAHKLMFELVSFTAVPFANLLLFQASQVRHIGAFFYDSLLEECPAGAYTLF